MATNRRRTPEQNKAAYRARNLRAQAAGYANYSQYRKAQEVSGSSSAYWEKRLRGKGALAQEWRHIADQLGFDPNDATAGIEFLRTENRARRAKGKDRHGIRLEWITSLNLSSTEASWLLYQLRQSPK